MKFSAQEEFGLRCLITLAREGEGGFLTIPEIAKREALSPSHVAKLLSVLRQAGYVASTRGQSGGYTLGAPAANILVSDVLCSLGGRLFDEGFCSRHVGQADPCVHDVDCSIRPLWLGIQAAIDQALEGVTLADVLTARLGAKSIVMHEDPDRRRIGA